MTSSDSPLLAFHSSPEFYHSGAVARGFHCWFLWSATASLAVSSPTTFSRHWAATHLKGYQPLSFGAFSAFHTLSRLSSARRLPALFHAGSALGVSPSGSFHSRSKSSFRTLFYPLAVSDSHGHCFNPLTNFGHLGRDRLLCETTFTNQRFARLALLQGFAPHECMFFH